LLVAGCWLLVAGLDPKLLGPRDAPEFRARKFQCLRFLAGHSSPVSMDRSPPFGSRPKRATCSPPVRTPRAPAARTRDRHFNS